MPGSLWCLCTPRPKSYPFLRQLYAVLSFPRAVILDVGGRRHKVLESNFNLFPNTRLGKLVRASTEGDILALCDGYCESLDDDHATVPEYFFDRNWSSFNSILDIYRNALHARGGNRTKC